MRYHDNTSPFSTGISLAGRLNDPAQTDVLSAVVRGSNVRDATTMTSLVKSLMLRQGTMLEVAAMRSACMALLVAKDYYQTDPIYLRFVRKVLTDESGNISIILLIGHHRNEKW